MQNSRSNVTAYYMGYIFANGRRIAYLEKLITDTSTWGCALSPWTKLKYITFPSLFINGLIFIMPLFIVVLIRGLFFDKSWRRHRGRNTFILFFALIFFLGLYPVPNSASQVGGPDTPVGLWSAAAGRRFSSARLDARQLKTLVGLRQAAAPESAVKCLDRILRLQVFGDIVYTFRPPFANVSLNNFFLCDIK